MGSRSKLSRAVSFLAVGALLALAGGGGGAIAAPSDVLTVKEDGGDFSSIQDAIDAAAPGDTIHVYPGEYVETAAGRYVLDGLPGESGPYQFGLFVGHDKGGLTIQGVDANGIPVHRWNDVEVLLTTNATNNFGPSGIFVEGDGVTIAGLSVGANLVGQNKTIEVSGDAFALLDCDIADLGGSLYIGDWRFDATNDASHIRSYRIEGNRFQDGVSLDLANGAGYSGDVEGRVIRHNDFANSGYWPSISFNGSDTGVPWFVHSVGGAVIKNNTFVNTFEYDDVAIHLESEGHIRARGTYDNDQFDWKSYWNENQYDRAWVVGPDPAKVLRAYAYPNAWGVFENVRRIGALLEGEELHQEPGDVILSK